MSNAIAGKKATDDSNLLIKNALLELRRLRNKLAAEQRVRNEPIAIIGTACRFSNGVDNSEKFYELLKNATDTVKEIPAERWDVEKFYDADPQAKGKMYTRHGSFIDQVDKFDAEFFNISGREADSLDPQQRLLLELSWEALENAGIVNTAIPKKRAGVFIAGMNVDYGQLVNDAGGLDVHTSSGTMVAVAAGRLAYVLGLHGPTMVVDTACSSSLVAVHVACQSLRSKECDVALAGSANLMLAPHAMIIECSTRMLAPDGRCKTFDAAANGFGRGEGGGMVTLKRLSDAQASGDNILAVIRGSAVNHDGPSSGLSVPNGLAQESVIRDALKNSQLEASDISYIEAHGTGTHLGDPIEIGALQGVFGRGRDKDKPLLVGSAKTNLGHLEWSAGIAGLIKTVVSLQHNKILPHINYSKPNPLIDWQTLNIRIPTSCESWPENIQPRAGVSSFGFSGTNCHVILEQAPTVEREEVKSRGNEIFALSAKNDGALKQQIKQYCHFLDDNSELKIEDICYTSGIGRSHFLHRLSVQCVDVTALKNKLASVDSGDITEGVYRKTVKENESVKWGFLCTGQGSQFVGMGKDLYQTEPVFRDVLDQCNDYLREQLPKPLLDVMFDEEHADELSKTLYTQPALYALEVALAALWSSWGIKPGILLGHSVGEYAAAHIAGVFSLNDGLKLISSRAKLMQSLPAGGAMAAVMSSISHLRPLIKNHENEISIAAINGVDNVVLSGESIAIDSICEILEADGIKTTRLIVSHAFHSQLMEPILDAFKDIANSIEYHAPKIPVISNISGKRAGDEMADANYWLKHVMAPVEFAKGMQSLVSEGATHYLELGPKPVLLGMARTTIDMDADRCFASLDKSQNDTQSMLSSLAKANVQGANINWQGLYANRAYRKVVLPNYSFQRKRYWIKSAIENKVDNDASIDEATSIGITQSEITSCIENADADALTKYIKSSVVLNKAEENILPVITKALINTHQQDVSNEKIKDWFYEIDWQEKAISPVDEANLKTGYWIVFSNTVLGEKLSTIMSENNQNCILVNLDNNYSSPEQGAWSMNPSEKIDYISLLKDTQDRFDDGCLGVIHLWAAEQISDDLDLDKAQNVCDRSLLYLMQAISSQNVLLNSGVWVVARGIYPVDEKMKSGHLAYSSLSGLGQSIALEYDDLWGGIIDLAATGEPADATCIMQHILANDSENRVAYRNKMQLVPRLTKKTFIRKKSPSVNEAACYLVTGGTGALGLRVVDWLVSRGAKNIAVLARRKPTDAIAERLNKWQAQGIVVTVHQADVSDKAAMNKVIESINNDQPLKGVVHAAGTLGDGLIHDMSWEKYSEVTAPKILGGWNLHLLTKDLNLDFFVLFSSAASVFGAAGQANYAAGNSFLDALAYHRVQQGLPAISINWGPWADAGMAADLDATNQTRMISKGAKEIDVDDGLACLNNLLGENPDADTSSQVAVLSIDWSELASIFSAKKGNEFLSEIPEFVTTEKDITDSTTGIYQEIKNVNGEKRADSLLDYLKGLVSITLKIERSSIKDDSDLMDLGIDSLMIMEMLDCIKRDLLLMIYPREVYGNPKIDSLANYISDEFASSHENNNLNAQRVNESSSTGDKEFFITEIKDPRAGLSSDYEPLDNMVFLLSTPRSGSTLLRAMLAGHTDLFSPPELHLLTFSSMAKRNASLKDSYLDEGLQRAIMELQGQGADEAKRLIDDLVERDAPVSEVYELLQELSGTRRVIDKSPTYALDPCILDRAEVIFNNAKYIHLVRNPTSSIESFARMRMDKLLSPGVNDPYHLAERVWTQGNENIDLFAQQLPKDRVLQVRFEDLVTDPETVITQICQFLEVDYDPILLQPYTGNRMTDGVHENSLSIGDPNFHEHDGIESSKADEWKNIELPNVLSQQTIQLATRFNYELPSLMETLSSIDVGNIDAPMEEYFIETRGLKFCICAWGDEDAPLIVLLHGILDQGAAWRQVAERLAHEGYRVIAPDLRGHGRSSPVGAGGSYNLMDFLADVDVIIEQITQEDFVLVGHSMGTILAAMYTSINMDKVKALVLVETVLPVPTDNEQTIDQVKVQLKYLKNPPKHSILKDIDVAIKQLQTMTPGLNDEYAQFLAERITVPDEDGIRWTWDPLLSTRAGIAGGIGMDKAGYLSLLSNIEVPTTLLFGDSSRFIRPADLVELKAAMNHSNHFTIKGGHQLHNESPQQVASYVIELSRSVFTDVTETPCTTKLAHEF